VPRLVVQSSGPGEVVARALSTGELAPRKGINVTYARPELPAITEKDLRDLALAAELGADFVALSFVRSAADIEQLRTLLVERGWRGRTVAKIEKVEAYEHLDEIIAAADGVMVARGDYGVEAGVAHVPLMQKDTIYRTTQAGKLVITATQMLESMIHVPEPTRAEATDVANAVIDGTSAVMLSAETSVGDYPVEAVRAMSQLAEAAEEFPEIHGRARPGTRDTPAAAVMHAAVELAEELDAAALLVYRAAWTKDAGAARITREAAMAKWFATEAAQRAVDNAVQLLGGRGVVLGARVERLYREVRALRIYEGTSEIQQLVIAGQLLAPYKTPAVKVAAGASND